MDADLHILPAIIGKIIEAQVPETPPPTSLDFSFLLPTKKRKETRDAFNSSIFSLPFKKRIFSPPPDARILPFDLNVALTPSDLHPLESLDLNVSVNPISEGGDSWKPDSDESVGTEMEHEYEIESKKEEEPSKIEEEEEEEDDDDGVVCAVCGDGDGEPTDPIVFCDGCNMMVHATCYGSPLINGVPDGDWFCSLCMELKGGGRLSNTCCCCLCPEVGGAMKETTEGGKWAHITCALLVPEVFFRDADGREGVDCSGVPEKRWGKECFVCGWGGGCTVECGEPRCGLAFHVTCGLKEELCVELVETTVKKKKVAMVLAFCTVHTAAWEKQKLKRKFRIVGKGKEGRKARKGI